MTSAPWAAAGRLVGRALEDESLGHRIARIDALEDLPEGVDLARTVVPRIRPSEAGITDPTILCPRILVVDDNDDNRYTLVLYLELEGYADIQIAEDGEQAIARLDKESFDVVLLDVMMPKVNGYEVLSWLKDRRRLHELPVIWRDSSEPAIKVGLKLLTITEPEVSFRRGRTITVREESLLGLGRLDRRLCNRADGQH